jgi:AraC-like DNA-binding protein
MHKKTRCLCFPSNQADHQTLPLSYGHFLSYNFSKLPARSDLVQYQDKSDFRRKIDVNSREALRLNTSYPIKAQNAGLFISRGKGIHPTRVIKSHELIFIKRGTMEMWEADRVFSLAEGQTLHLWPMQQHGGTNEMPPDLEFYWLHFETASEMEISDVSDDWIEIPQVKQISRPEKLESLFRYFLDDQESGCLQQCTANLLTMLMLVEVARMPDVRQGQSDAASVLATRAETYIRLNFDRSITAGMVARALDYNPDYLGRVYREAFGCTLTEAIQNRRIQVACHYLLDTDMTIGQVAESCGFNDPDYFRRVFHRHIKHSPGAYRKLYARIHVNTL